MSEPTRFLERAHVLLDAPDDAVDAAIATAERTARHHTDLGEEWIDGDAEQEELGDAPLVWRDDLESVGALLVARKEALAPLVARARAMATIEIELSGISPLQSAVLTQLASIDPAATIVTQRGQVLPRSEHASQFPIPIEPRRGPPRFDGGVDAELFRALCEQGLLEVTPDFDADAAAASWAASGREETGEALMEWLVDRADIEEVHASEDDLERAMALRW